ncbi:CPBP family glutamic-type intramembrane protease [Candidatus Arthromitus sp. SFB-rat-Yit]|uniref:CPBP family glutamic-type intramembrane protease n=1 Tax=Candidatus Arthromitus sp. SFB-rat-Yit TaxID=1041504 RepID=UPI000318ECA7|nr:CPBP family glutamic-type intramembrane protease [Candidatus Arthromitus sp. SFB-rat-Yit]
MTKTKLFNFILFMDFIIYIFSNLILFKYVPQNSYYIFYMCLRDIILFLFSIAVYLNFYNSRISSMLVFPKLNSKIIKNSIIIGISFYLIANGVNLIFTSIFKFTLGNRFYLNNIYIRDYFGFEFIFYIFVHTIFTELFFRCILKDAFKFLSNKARLVLSSIIFSFFFFGLSQIVYGFVIGILLMCFLDRIGSMITLIIASLSINMADYFVRVIGNKFPKTIISSRVVVNNSSDIFVNLIIPIIIILVGIIIYSILRENIKIKIPSVLPNNVKEGNFNISLSNVVDIYVLLFFVTYFIITFIGYKISS